MRRTLGHRRGRKRVHSSRQSHVSGSGDIYVAGLGLEGTPKGNFISIPFADSVLRDYVSYTPSQIQTPIYDYNSSYLVVREADGFAIYKQNDNTNSIVRGKVMVKLQGNIGLRNLLQKLES